MPRPRKRWLLVLAVCAVTVLAVALRPRGPRPCLATFERVRVGMTKAEIVATVGAPPNLYESSREGKFLSGYSPVVDMWEADDGALAVVYTDEDRAASVDVISGGQSSLWDRLRARLPW